MKITMRIPREIGEWIEYCKSCSITLYGALDPVDKFGMSIAETFKGDAHKCAKWARTNSNDFAKVLTQQNVNQNMRTFKKLITVIIAVLVLAFVANISKYLLAPNYSILVDEILPKLSQK